MSKHNLIFNAFYELLDKPVLHVHLALRTPGRLTAYRLEAIKTHTEHSDVFDIAGRYRRRDIAVGVADLFVSQGLHLSKVVASPEAGLIELELTPLMARHPMLAQAHTNNEVTLALGDIVDAIAHEIQSGSLKEWDDDSWATAFGLNSGCARKCVKISNGTRLRSHPGLYNLHMVKDPSLLIPRCGEAFANDIERVVYVCNFANIVIPEEAMALPLERFEKLARAHGFDKFFFENDSELWISKSA